MGIPTIIINNSLHEKVVEKWPLLKNIYNNFSFFIEDSKEIENLFSKNINLISGNNIDSCTNDIKHIYKYYSSNSANNALQYLAEL